ncbi:MAG: FecR family protein [Mangrovibacterium sp.]
MSQIHKIINRYIKNDQLVKVIKNFAIWLTDNRNRAEKEAALLAIWEEIDVQADESTEISFQKLHKNIISSSKRQKQTFQLSFSKVAVFLILALLSVGTCYFTMKEISTTKQIVLQECIVPNGEVRTLVLPDSSIVIVNSGSIIVYPDQFTTSRQIFLNGEAYFEVKKDERKPFVVKTTDMDIEVLGTIFNVSSYADNQNSSTTLKSGKVNLKFKDGKNEPLILLPNEQLTYNRSSSAIEKQQVNVENTTAWVDGRLIIQSMPVEEVIKLIERKYALNVYVTSNDFMGDRITMKVSNSENIHEFMSVLKHLIPQLKYKIENNNLYIN